MTTEQSLTFRFRPRYRLLPVACIVLGAALGVSALSTGMTGTARVFALACAVLGPLIGGGYFLSPAWRMRVVIDDEALSVFAGDTLRFRAPWAELKQVLHAPASKTCFVHGGERGKSLLVPGPGAPAPYRIERREALYDAILARVPPGKLRELADLSLARPG